MRSVTKKIMVVGMVRMVVPFNMTMLVVLKRKLGGSPSWSAQYSRIVSMRLENKERMMLVVVGALLGKDESESIS